MRKYNVIAVFPLLVIVYDFFLKRTCCNTLCSTIPLAIENFLSNALRRCFNDFFEQNALLVFQHILDFKFFHNLILYSLCL